MDLHIFGCLLAVSPLTLFSEASLAGDDPFADVVHSFDLGRGSAPGYDNPAVTLGSPERFTGEGIFPGVVSAFNGPYGFDEIFSIGIGGHLVVEFNTPVTDDPNNLYGIDLLVFGNTAFIDNGYPNGIAGALFGNDGGTIEVSADGVTWHLVPNVMADGPMPTVGYSDAGPYDLEPGRVPSKFTRPVDPLVTSNLLLGMNNAQILERYRGSGGGAGVDLASVGLSQIRFVRVANPSGAMENIEIDAFSDVAPRMPGDVNLDELVNVNDLLLVISAWGAVAPGGPPADFDNDGFISVNDLLIVIGNWS